MHARSLLLAVAACAIAAPAAASKSAIVSPDPMTVSGRFALPRASEALARQARLAVVKVDSALAAKSRRDGPALETAFDQAVRRSLDNFGYLAADNESSGTTLDVELLPVFATTDAGAMLVTVRLRFTATGAQADCLSRQTEGRFRVLERQRSGGGRRALAVGAVVGMAFLGATGGTFMADQFTMASAENELLNAQRKTGAGEGVAPSFKDAEEFAYGANLATQLALADYICQLGTCDASGISPS